MEETLDAILDASDGLVVGEEEGGDEVHIGGYERADVIPADECVSCWKKRIDDTWPHPPQMDFPKEEEYWSPENVETKGRPLTLKVYGFVAYSLMYAAIFAASSSPA